LAQPSHEPRVTGSSAPRIKPNGAAQRRADNGQFRLTIIFPDAQVRSVNLNPHQKFDFCARQQTAAGRALHICPTRPGAAS
jgi:hypothetical protein